MLQFTFACITDKVFGSKKTNKLNLSSNLKKNTQSKQQYAILDEFSCNELLFSAFFEEKTII